MAFIRTALRLSGTSSHLSLSSSSSSLIVRFNTKYHYSSTPEPNPSKELEDLLRDKCKSGFKNQEDALVLFDKMLKTRPFPTNGHFTKLLSAVVKTKHYSVAVSVLREMESRNISMGLCAYTILVDAYVKDGRLNDAEDLIELMIQRGLYPNVVTYNSLMNGYCLRGEVDKAFAVLETMPTRKGTLANICSYNMLINGYCKKKKVDRAIHLLQQMPIKGLTPTIEIYNTILQGLFDMGRHDEALKFFKERMLNKGIRLSTVTWSILLNGLCKNHYVVEALSFFNMMECAGLIPDICICNKLIDVLSKNGHHEKARRLFDKLRSKGLRPDVNILSRRVT